jgi:predicted dehydrogenase
MSGTGLGRLRVGVIGAGRMGERHCRVYAGIAGVEFCGVSDVSPERGQAVARRYGVPWFAHHDDLLATVDAVTIATPTRTHFRVASDCLARGVHVLVEKPLAGDVAEARELVRRAEQTRLVLQVGHIERFNPAVLELQSVLEDEAVVAMSARRLSPFDTSNTDVDVVYDLMIHDIDLTLALLGRDVASVQACGRSTHLPAADHVVAMLSLTDGPVVTLTASRVTEQKVRQLEITARGAFVDVDLLSKTVCIYRRTLPEFISNHQRPLRYRQENFVERIQIPTAEPLLLELESFVRCVRLGTRPVVTGADGLQAMELAARIRTGMGVAGLPARGVHPAPDEPVLAAG